MSYEMDRPPDLFAVSREVIKVYWSIVGIGLIRIPLRTFKNINSKSDLMSLDTFWQIFGAVVLDIFDSLGPIYGKGAQVILSRMNESTRQKATRANLDRIYGDWPPIPFAEVKKILDKEIPDWKDKLEVEENALGVASVAQVHLARDKKDSKEWVIKVIKPQARKRLHETLNAINQIISIVEPFALTKVSKRTLRELREMGDGFRSELRLDLERKNIESIRSKISTKKGVIYIPGTLDELCNRNVLVVERIQGVSLADLVQNKAKIDKNIRKKLAKGVLKEMLVQIFELGLFHGDPHAGNLILMEDGTVGLFDWGLTGELLESDRKHIAGILKAIMSMNMEMLIDVMEEMAADSDKEISRARIKKELNKVARMVLKAKESGEKVSMQKVLESSLKAASKLGIQVPDGLLMMAKSLLTVEGLAKGIDPRVSFKSIAAPVLFRAARPGIRDVIKLTTKAPSLAMTLLRNRA